MMKLYAISDLHLHYEENREALSGIPESPEDWIIIGGDTGEQIKDLEFALDILTSRFGKVFWVPGNHELWTMPNQGEDGQPQASEGPRGVEKYKALLKVCKDYGVVTPEDPFTIWPGAGPPCVIAPLFNLYDYSFRPDHVSLEGALDWALETGIMCNDEALLHADPYENKIAWCRERLAYSERRLKEVNSSPETKDHQLVLINHFPLRYEHVRLWRIPRFSLWCGTKATEDWHTRFNARVVVYGHLHIRATDWRDGVRFEEVSLGYPNHWRRGSPIKQYMREILPGLSAPS